MKRLLHIKHTIKHSSLQFYLLVVCCVFVGISNGTSQDSGSIKQFDLVLNPRIVEVDNLGRIYIVDDKNILINFFPNLTEQYRFANRRSGAISSLDLANPLRVVAFYDDFNQVKIFDNTLTIITELNLAENFIDVSACGVSNDANLWIYDPYQFKLIKIQDNGAVILESSNVNDFGMSNVKITDIKEKGNFVLLCDRNKGFYFFDNLGQYLYHFQATDIRSVQFDGQRVFYYTSSGLMMYDVIQKEQQMIQTVNQDETPRLQYVLYTDKAYYQVFEHGIQRIK